MRIADIRMAMLVTIVLASGCWKDIPYDPAAERADEAPRATEPTTDRAASEPDDLARRPSASPDAGTIEQDQQGEATEPEDDFGAELFGEEIAGIEPPAGEAHSASDEPAAAESTDQVLGEDEPPAEADEPDATPTFDELLSGMPEPAEQVEPVDESPGQTPAADSASSLLPWETPADSGEPSESAAGDDVSEMAGAAVLPWEGQDTPQVQADAPQAEPPQAGTPYLIWRLGSRLSYALVAPEADVEAIAEELWPLAQSLSIELPELRPTAELSDVEQLRQLLDAGRELGTEVSDRYGPASAALMEIAFKSNMLMKVASSRPQLKHAVNGSVAAAAVRSGIPESIWQPWQDRVAESESDDEIAEAVIDLHTQVGSYLQRPQATEADTPPSVVR